MASFERLELHHRDRLGVAVSGGGDSMALLHLLARWRPEGLRLHAVSVNHGLRPAAADECQHVAAFARQWAIPHAVVTLDPSTWSGNRLAAARHARYDALAAWARDQAITMIALGHNRTDQAETILMNLARGSGVNGLAAMPPCRRQDGIDWVRPLLDIGRTELRAYLREEQVPWVEDPGNESDAFQRIRIRKFLADNALGLTEQNLVLTAGHMQAVKSTLDDAVAGAIVQHVKINAIGEYRISSQHWQLKAAVRSRMYAHMVRQISDSRYPPRTHALDNSLNALLADGIATIGGAILSLDASDNLVLVRDHQRCLLVTVQDDLWDHRWQVRASRQLLASCEVGPLGLSAARRLVKMTDEGFSQRGLAATPALWHDGTLISHVLDDGNAAVSFVYCRRIRDLVNDLRNC